MTQDTQHVVPADAQGERLDKFLQTCLPQLTRGQAQDLIKQGAVTLNDKPVKASERLRVGDLVAVQLPERAESARLQAEDIPLNVVYEDSAVVVLNKPAGLVVHPGLGNTSGTLVNALLARYPSLAQLADTLSDDDNEDAERVGIVHRLDKETSGLMVVALTQEAHRELARQFQERTVEKAYLALLERVPKTLTGLIDAPIGRDPKQRKRMSVQPDGRPAQTQFDVLDVDFKEPYALVRLKIFTGRTHQIRVHMAFIGCPVVGDGVYGFRKRRLALDRHFLHATHLAFDHPITRQRMAFDAPLPNELQEVLARLR
jgi:23S rRNA pseudouridine1911/1915/1917 synthase